MVSVKNTIFWEEPCISCKVYEKNKNYRFFLSQLSYSIKAECENNMPGLLEGCK